MSSVASIILNAQLLSQRLKNRESDVDRILAGAEEVNNQLETMRQFKDDLDLLNSIARDRSNTEMINQINQQNPQLREMHTENIRLRVSLEDHQRALEHIMSKYREHTQTALENSKINFEEMFRGETEKSLIIQRQEQKIQEMIAIMQKAASLDDTEFEEDINRDRENINRLIVENQGLRELLAISKKSGTVVANNNDNSVSSSVSSSVAAKISVETQTDPNANQS